KRRAIVSQQRRVNRLQSRGAHDGQVRIVQPDDLDPREHTGRHPPLGQRRPKRVEVLGAGIWKRLQKRRVDRAEDRGGRTNPERERGNRGQRKCRGPPKVPKGEPEVLKEGSQGGGYTP